MMRLIPLTRFSGWLRWIRLLLVAVPLAFAALLLNHSQNAATSSAVSQTLAASRQLGAPSTAARTINPPSPAVVPDVQTARTHVVEMWSNYFSPAFLVINAGDTVVWVNRDGIHTSTSYDGLWDSGLMYPGETFSYTFDTPATYGYKCIPHEWAGMVGAIVVLPAGEPVPTPTPTTPAEPPSSSPTPGPSATPEALVPGTITTVAGGAGDGGPATTATLYLPERIAFDAAGNLYIADTANCRVRRVDPGGTIVTLAGHAQCGAEYDGDLGPWAHVNYPRDVAPDGQGNLYIADAMNCRVRRVNAAGYIGTAVGSGSCTLLSPWAVAVDAADDVYIVDVLNCRVRKMDSGGELITVAGSGVCGFGGDGGPATAAELMLPRDIALDSSGGFYVADTGNCRVRYVDPTGKIDTVAGIGSCAFSGDGGAATAAGLDPRALAVDDAGNLYIADTQSCRVRRVDPGGTITTVAGTGACGFDGDGGPALAALLNYPKGVAIDPEGRLHIADTENCRIRQIDDTGRITTIAGSGICNRGGDGAPATSATVWHAVGVTFDADGNWYFSEQTNCRIRRVDLAGIITTVAGGQCGYGGDGGPALGAAFGSFMGDIEMDDHGDLYVADSTNCRIRRVDAAGIVTTFAGNGACEYSGDGGPATAAGLDFPSDVLPDGAGGLYIADAYNCRVRYVDSNGVISTVAGNGSCAFAGDGGPAVDAGIDPWAVSLDEEGNLYVADAANCRVRRIDPDGIITTFAGNGLCDYVGDGGPATDASLHIPRDLTFDAEGNLYIADVRNFVIRRVDPDGVISTIAGTGIHRPDDIGGWDPAVQFLCGTHVKPRVKRLYYLGDGGPATEGNFYFPYGVAFHRPTGRLYVADTFTHRVRMVQVGELEVTPTSTATPPEATATSSPTPTQPPPSPTLTPSRPPVGVRPGVERPTPTPAAVPIATPGSPAAPLLPSVRIEPPSTGSGGQLTASAPSAGVPWPALLAGPLTAFAVASLLWPRPRR